MARLRTLSLKYSRSIGLSGFGNQVKGEVFLTIDFEPGDIDRLDVLLDGLWGLAKKNVKKQLLAASKSEEARQRADGINLGLPEELVGLVFAPDRLTVEVEDEEAAIIVPVSLKARDGRGKLRIQCPHCGAEIPEDHWIVEDEDGRRQITAICGDCGQGVIISFRLDKLDNENDAQDVQDIGFDIPALEEDGRV